MRVHDISAGVLVAGDLVFQKLRLVFCLEGAGL